MSRCDGLARERVERDNMGEGYASASFRHPSRERAGQLKEASGGVEKRNPGLIVDGEGAPLDVPGSESKREHDGGAGDEPAVETDGLHEAHVGMILAEKMSDLVHRARGVGLAP